MIAYFMYQVFVIFVIFVAWMCVFRCLILIRQKTRDPQQPRMYVGSVRTCTSLTQGQPAIYITPVNIPPPKYEMLAPPSYEEVVGVHYPATLAIVAQPTAPQGTPPSNPEPHTSNPEPQPRNPEPQPRNPEPQPRNPEPQISNPENNLGPSTSNYGQNTATTCVQMTA